MTQELKASVSDMLRTTGKNTAEFMEQVSLHIDKLENAIGELENELLALRARVAELETTSGDDTQA
jgi:polyhydroxyalkanoate synthesis regulator phasin